MPFKKIMPRIAVPVCVLAVSACAHYEADHYLTDVNSALAERAGLTLERSPLEAVRPMPLAGVIRESDVILSVLVHNKDLQARLEGLNVAHAEEVQAGLLLNPLFDGEATFTGGEPVVLDLSLGLNIGQFLTRPARMRAAKGDRLQAQTQTIEAILTTIADARFAYLDLFEAQQMLDVNQRIRAHRRTALAVGEELHKIGNITLGDVAALDMAFLEADIAVASSELAVLAAREALSSVAGRPLGGALSLELPAQEADTLLERARGRAAPQQSAARADDAANTASAFVQVALEESLLLAADKQALAGLVANVDIAAIDVWVDDLEASFVLEREEGEFLEGFGLALPVPIFDAGGTRTGRAKARLAEQQYTLQANMQRVANRAQAVFTLYDSLKAARARFLHRLDQAAGNYTAFARQSFNAMQTGPLKLIDDQIIQMMAEKRQLALEMRYRRAGLMIAGLSAGLLPDLNTAGMQAIGSEEAASSASTAGH